MGVCHSCRKEISVPRIIGRRDMCPVCGDDLRCCRNCRFYDERAYNQCRESQAERVLEKERSNFCDYFVFNESDAGQATAFETAARDGLEALFKK